MLDTNVVRLPPDFGTWLGPCTPPTEENIMRSVKRRIRGRTYTFRVVRCEHGGGTFYISILYPASYSVTPSGEKVKIQGCSAGGRHYKKLSGVLSGLRCLECVHMRDC